MKDPRLQFFPSGRTVVLLIVVLLMGCTTHSVVERFSCPEDDLAQWHIPAGWLKRELTPTEARVEVLTANLSKEATEARWDELRNQWRNGDAYWLYRRPADDTRNALGVQEGVVLIRGCEQPGFVTTRIATESTGGRRP